MAKWIEDFLLYFLDVLPSSAYNRGQIKRHYYQQKTSVRNKWRVFQRRAPVHYTRLQKLLHKYNRKYFTRRLISRDQRLFNGQVLASEAFEWDMNAASTPVERLVSVVNKYQILTLLSDASDDPERFGVHQKHQQMLKDTTRLLLEHLRKPDRHPEDTHVYQNIAKDLDRILFEWEGVSLPCHSYYDVLATVLSILGRAPAGATRQNHHLAFLIILAKFFIVIAGDKARSLAPSPVSIMFTDEETDVEGLNIIRGATLPKHKTFKEEIRLSRYDVQAAAGFALLGKNKSWDRWLCGHCAETFALVLFKRQGIAPSPVLNTTFTGKRVGGISLELKGVLEMDDIDDVRLGDLQDPCKNCQEELKRCDVDPDRFRVNLMA